jgi:hypothetical protein
MFVVVGMRRLMRRFGAVAPASGRRGFGMWHGSGAPGHGTERRLAVR